MPFPSRNHSPWIDALDRTRALHHLDQTRTEDLVIIGGGIAGIMTAAFTLLSTKRSILLLEATRVAHGATGHNAGQIVSYFERPLPDLVKQFGLKAMAEATRAIEGTWQTLFDLRDRLNLQTPIFSFSGFLGLHEPEAIRAFLKTMQLRAKMGLPLQPLYVAQEARAKLDFSAAEEALITWLPKAEVLKLLETPDAHFIAAQSERKGVTNSALLCEEITSLLLARFPDRFFVIEETPVLQITCGKQIEIVTKGKHKIYAKDVVLCTNGFESFRLRTEDGGELNRRFRKMVQGDVAHMAGYVGPANAPIAISYVERGYVDNPSYAYMTRRPHGLATSLTCWGGPDKPLPEGDIYDRSRPMAPEKIRELRALIGHLAPKDAKKPFLFHWHGLMGYTKNGIRLIGRDPQQKHLFYNLGCNGIGILPSIYGGKRLAELFGGKALAESIFEPS